jgi:hypothetical protein
MFFQRIILRALHAGQRVRLPAIAWLTGAFCVAMSPVHSARAAPVSDLYAAEVPLREGSRSPLEDGFRDALAQVLVKVTGRREVARDESLLARFGDPAALVQQYRMDATTGLWARFDALAVKRILDATGESIWGADRPTTLVWLAIDPGGGRREILAAGPELAEGDGLAGMRGAEAESEVAQAVREVLMETGGARGLPLILPLVDSEDLGQVTVADVWGDFTGPVIEASRRYAADAVLIGKARIVGHSV